MPRIAGENLRYLRVARCCGLLLLLSVIVSSCAHRRSTAGAPVYVPPPPSSQTPALAAAPHGSASSVPAGPPVAWFEEGVASWYGVPYHGRRAANGEIYDMYQLTAAHKTLPFNSVLRVTNLQNGLQTEVRVNDRGPFVEGRIIDLSLAAARAIDMVGMGVAKVRLELLSGANPEVGYFTVQVGAFLVADNAEKLRQRMAQKYQAAFVQTYDSPHGLFYRVRVGKLASENEARELASRLREEEQVVAFVVRLD